LNKVLFFVLTISFFQLFSQDLDYYTPDPQGLFELEHPEPRSPRLLQTLNFHLTYGLKTDTLKNAISLILENHKQHSRKVIEKSLEIANGFYPDELNERVQAVLESKVSERALALSAYYLSKRMEISEDLSISPIILKKLKGYHSSMESKDPPLDELFSHVFQDKPWVLFSIQTRTREHSGILVIRKPDNRFLRNENGSIFSIPQLGRAITNLPYFFSNGHTPSGIYKLGPKVISKNPAIGKTPSLVLQLPGEVSFSQFWGRSGTWSSENHLKHFPKSWQNHAQILESLDAGLLGRSGIWMHGSTLNPDTFKESSFYPLTPAFGCLTTYEFWDSSRQIVYSGQDAFWKVLGEAPVGYLVVVNRSFDRPILLEDIIKDIIKSEFIRP
jgi:hypothetical protein